MLHWFVEENVVLKALDGIAIEESNVEVDPNNLCSGVADENVTLEKIQKFFTDDAWTCVLSTGTCIYSKVCVFVTLFMIIDVCIKFCSYTVNIM